ncbi:hypothetical protein BX616_006977 [Lobosporangium transversale]|uniref:C2H2-type domain-containing protein n=1 Tax=Lobosporangium transversale TaxID=64571 RepID=A0A1Y2GTJ6_9FUNG|nr:hypothetical protein BCR41DRAFT_29890 [Lobosporangium transversale]KAF9915064.1 hypothetical protein BX616_006977 [Lobosporangium transversale]ORZ21015.1 hypothetical protein BCR41DRAFT_29890 [Lobosporangium transversale]|eukprot:XP_021882924.1 hypothetical protein BCR41DRAFT_29890 [Lobosporangium transversale]
MSSADIATEASIHRHEDAQPMDIDPSPHELSRENASKQDHSIQDSEHEVQPSKSPEKSPNRTGSSPQHRDPKESRQLVGYESDHNGGRQQEHKSMEPVVRHVHYSNAQDGIKYHSNLDQRKRSFQHVQSFTHEYDHRHRHDAPHKLQPKTTERSHSEEKQSSTTRDEIDNRIDTQANEMQDIEYQGVRENTNMNSPEDQSMNSGDKKVLEDSGTNSKVNDSSINPEVRDDRREENRLVSMCQVEEYHNVDEVKKTSGEIIKKSKKKYKERSPKSNEKIAEKHQAKTAQQSEHSTTKTERLLQPKQGDSMELDQSSASRTLSKGSANDEAPDAPPPKGTRSTKRAVTKRVPKVYPPRKPRARPVIVEPIGIPMQTDALSTLASAAVAIQDQSSLTNLSGAPRSPNPQVGTGSPPEPVETTKGQTKDTETAPAATQSSKAAGRSPLKTNVTRDEGGYRCEHCPGERFGRVHDLKRHQISKHNEMTWPCDFCHRPFVRRDALLRHYSVKAARRDGVHPTDQEENRLQEAKARAKLHSRDTK